MPASKFQGQYRIASARLQSWDYGWDGAYFVTVCTAQRVPVFGKIIEDEMILSQIGSIAQKYWYTIPDHSKNITLGAFVVMPNHIHGILEFEQKNWEDDIEARKDKACLVSTKDRSERTVGAARLRNQGKNTLSPIVGSYKSVVSKYAHRQNPDFAWQPRFYDHLIRNEQSHEHITNYIRTNPQNWQKDKFYIAPNTN